MEEEDNRLQVDVFLKKEGYYAIIRMNLEKVPNWTEHWNEFFYLFIFTENRFKVKIREADVSKVFEGMNRIPQGSAASLLLFNMMTK